MKNLLDLVIAVLGSTRCVVQMPLGVLDDFRVKEMGHGLIGRHLVGVL